MKLIAEITDKEILGKEGLSFAEPRYTARAIVKNGDLYAVIHSEKFHPYSLPGGGVDDGEDILTALKREILEETGCTCGNIAELGMIKENRAQADYTQISYYYVVEADSVGVPHFTEAETNSGTELQWHRLSEMIKLINDIHPKTYQQQYLKARDVAALKEYITNYIFMRAQPCDADAIFVVGGSLPEAAEFAAELYKNKYADKIIIGGKFSVKRDCFSLPEYETEYDFYKDILLRNGVNENDIYGEKESGYTKQNAEYAKRVVDGNHLSIRKALIVCKSFHAKRCLLLYQMYFPNVDFTVVTFDGFDISKNNWYQTEYGRERVMGEIKRIEEQTGEHYANLG